MFSTRKKHARLEKSQRPRGESRRGLFRTPMKLLGRFPMNWFMNLKIGKKLGLGFGLVEVLMISMGLFAIAQLSKVNDSTVEITTNWLPSIRELGDLRFDTASVRRDTLNYIVSTGDKKAQFEEKIKNDFNQVAADEKTYEPLIASEEERKIYQESIAQWNKYAEVNAQVRELAKDGKNSEAVQLAQSIGGPLFEASAKALAEDVALNNQGADNADRKSVV